jgi:hypothetical protein
MALLLSAFWQGCVNIVEDEDKYMASLSEGQW